LSFTVVIPARFASTRLPGKPLLQIADKPMIQHVFERAQESGAERIIVATDDARIQTVVEAFGGEVVLTEKEHQSGTDRIAEVARRHEFADDQIVVNLQGDEPLMEGRFIRLVAENLATTPEASMSTACVKVSSVVELFNPNVVKVVRDKAGMALYFSRATIPWNRDEFAQWPDLQSQQSMPKNAAYFRHIGLYAYRVGFLQQFTRWQACELEQTESLEQLRVLWHGGRIHVAELDEVPPPGVDTEADLEAVRAIMQKK